MDRAVLRPGRFGKLLYVPLPSPDERVLILKALARKEAVDASVDLSDIAKMEACENLSGADLAALVCLCSLLMLSVSSLYHCCMLCMYVYGCLILGGYKVLQLQRLDYRKSGSQFERDTDFIDFTDEWSSNGCSCWEFGLNWDNLWYIDHQESNQETPFWGSTEYSLSVCIRQDMAYSAISLSHEIWCLVVNKLVLEIYNEIYFEFWSSKSSTISTCQRALKQHEQHGIRFFILAGDNIPMGERNHLC